MKLAKIIFLSIFFAVFFSSAQAAEEKELLFFYSPNCGNCLEVKTKVLPKISAQYKGIKIDSRDITDMENYELLLYFKDKLSPKAKLDIPVIVFAHNFLNGKEKIKNHLERLIQESLRKSTLETEKAKIRPGIDLTMHFLSFSLLSVIGAGLIDGINPCAFTVIVFFISFLALQGYRKRELVFIGLAFIAAVFITYILIGIGLFGFFYRLESFWLVRKIFNVSVGIFSIILGVLAVSDFIKFKKTRQSEGLILQLPQAVKNQIHRVIGIHYRKEKGSPGIEGKNIGRLILTALATGFLVSILEAVCTGQTYLPTIAFILKTGTLKLSALTYLVVYNIMFILPLFVVFLFALLGVTSEQFSHFLKKHLLFIKVLMAVLFFGFGIYLLKGV